MLHFRSSQHLEHEIAVRLVLGAGLDRISLQTSSSRAWLAYVADVRMFVHKNLKFPFKYMFQEFNRDSYSAYLSCPLVNIRMVQFRSICSFCVLKNIESDF